MSFEIWLQEGRVKRHKPAKQEIASLAALADRRLADSRVAKVSAEGRFLLAYYADLPGHHAVTIASLALTLGAEPAAVAALDAWRRKRNRATYDLPGAVSEHEVRELTTLVEKLKADFHAWLRARHPALI